MADRSTVAPPLNVLKVALGVSLLCALLVSFTAVSLRPYYLANLEAERMARLGSILDALQQVSVSHKAEEFEVRVVNLEDGTYSETIDPDQYDARREASDPRKGVTIPAELDLPGIKRRARYAVVYLLRDTGGRLEVIILPVRGVGYQSALYGYLALDHDASEILALKFYEQGETPGLGSQIMSPAWEAQWPGKQAFDAEGEVNIQFDAISGATRTSIGVDRLIRFWLGDFGFGPYLKRVREGEA
ncbi:MAG: NADH:ubiquinone reductase (Na(+)-transporting) subunit C [Gammaproteobacteria bacterium]|nr:NADH:ubiquinone reductase (Na(+)-transporting) subunit C [Gammaproteobacteria bacterium]